MKKVRIVYFSGTGGTRMAAGELAARITQQGGSVSRYELRYDAELPRTGWESHFLILCFPVYASNAPSLVERWVSQLTPLITRTSAAVISVSGGGDMWPNRACRVGINRRLSRRGFRVEYETMLVMPSNWIVATKPSLASALLKILPWKISEILAEISCGRIRRTFPGPLDRLVSLLGRVEHPGGRIFGRHIQVMKSCNSCGICVAGCPSGNISITEKYPDFGSVCVLCLKCIYSCPRQALKPGFAKFLIIKEGYNLKSVSTEVPGNGYEAVIKEARGVLWLGLRRYFRQ